MSDDDGVDRQRAYTDLLTGSMQLLDIPAKALFKYLLQGRLPSVFLPSFLHEATHFWCMATDLGAALALLELRTHRAFDDEGNYDRIHLLRDHGITSVAQQLLRPLLEGMALFQEFDAAPGNSSVLSSPGYWAARLFQPLDSQIDPPKDPSKGGEWLSHEIRKTLINYRTSGAASRRKTGVLMRSFITRSSSLLGGLSYRQKNLDKRDRPYTSLPRSRSIPLLLARMDFSGLGADQLHP